MAELNWEEVEQDLERIIAHAGNDSPMAQSMAAGIIVSDCQFLQRTLTDPALVALTISHPEPLEYTSMARRAWEICTQYVQEEIAYEQAHNKLQHVVGEYSRILHQHGLLAGRDHEQSKTAPESL